LDKSSLNGWDPYFLVLLVGNWLQFVSGKATTHG
jgi:hypothetical protein